MWKQNFMPHILERGNAYYDHGFVEIVSRHANQVVAIVSGSEDYEVVVEMEENVLATAECDCPHFESGNNCKHMAAVLFAIEASTPNTEAEPVKEKKDSVSQIVEEADGSLVRSFLTEILASDQRLLRDFKRLKDKTISLESMTTYKKQVNAIFKKYGGRYNFVDYKDASKLYHDICQFIAEEVQQWIYYEHYLPALEMTNYIAQKVGKQEIDDSSGYMCELLDDCKELWHAILDGCDMAVQNKAFERFWLMAHENNDFIDDVIVEMIFSRFDDEVFLTSKLEKIDDIIQSQMAIGGRLSLDYRFSSWLRCRINVMGQLNFTTEEVKDFCRAYWKVSAMRQHYIDLCLEQGDHLQAIEVLKESQKLDSEYRGLVANYGLRLKEIYFEYEMIDEYRQQLWHLLKDRPRDLMGLFRELKVLYGQDQWEIKREYIFGIYEDQTFDLCELYHEEKLIDRLFEVMMTRSYFNLILKYEDVLLKQYPLELLQRYEQEIHSRFIHTQDRKHYAETVRLMRRMAKYPNGEELAKQLAIELATLYPRRKAMIEELSKL